MRPQASSVNLARPGVSALSGFPDCQGGCMFEFLTRRHVAPAEIPLSEVRFTWENMLDLRCRRTIGR